jgi:hypothetical protein
MTTMTTMYVCSEADVRGGVDPLGLTLSRVAVVRNEPLFCFESGVTF